MPADETPKTAIWGSKSETPWIELTFEDDAGARDRERVGELEAEVASLRQQLDDARTQAENASVDAFAYQDGARGFYEDATALRSQLAAAEADRDRLLVVYPGSREVAGFTEWSRIVEPKPELTAAEHDWQSPRGKKQRRCAKCERWETLWSKQWPCNVPSPR